MVYEKRSGTVYFDSVVGLRAVSCVSSYSWASAPYYTVLLFYGEEEIAAVTGYYPKFTQKRVAQGVPEHLTPDELLPLLRCLLTPRGVFDIHCYFVYRDWPDRVEKTLGSNTLLALEELKEPLIYTVINT
jgi:hypothetical protein